MVGFKWIYQLCLSVYGQLLMLSLLGLSFDRWGSFFLVNLCLVVITMQFQETKAREIELMEHSKKETGLDHPSSLMSFVKFLRTLCKCASKDKEPQVHHHHHHFYHHHDFHHHLYNCFVPASPVMLSNVRNVSDLARSSEIPEIKSMKKENKRYHFLHFPRSMMCIKNV